MARGGRPHKFTRDTVDRLMRAIRMGLTYELACMHAGISYDTLNDWRNNKFPRNLDDDQKHMKLEFADMFTRAEGDAAARHMGTIMQAAAQGDWKASAWALERRWPHHYGKSAVEITGKDGGPIEITPKLHKMIEQFAAEEGITGDEEELAEAVRLYLEDEEDSES